jgi:hypothetical protein
MEEFPMPFVDTSALPVIERLPGWHGRYFPAAERFYLTRIVPWMTHGYFCPLC